MWDSSCPMSHFGDVHVINRNGHCRLRRRLGKDPGETFVLHMEFSVQYLTTCSDSLSVKMRRINTLPCAALASFQCVGGGVGCSPPQTPPPPIELELRGKTSVLPVMRRSGSYIFWYKVNRWPLRSGQWPQTVMWFFVQNLWTNNARSITQTLSPFYDR